MTPEQITQELTDRGVYLDSTLVRDEFDGRAGAAYWAVTILRDGQAYQTEYSAGAGHRYYPKRCRIVPLKYRGKPVPFGHLDARSVHDIERNKQSKPTQPNLADVLYCIVSDAQDVAFGETFEEFAESFGYDTDSRSAEKCFNGCRDSYFAMIRLFGQRGFEELCELFQDY
jgi:hypothetical protein